MRQDVNSIIKARVSELIGQSEFSFSSSKFLTPAEQSLFFRSVQALGSIYSNKCFFFGGCRGADRRAAVFFPDWADLSEAPPNTSLFSPERESFFLKAVSDFAPEDVHGIAAVKIKGSGYEKLGHRDYLGSVLGLGIERNVVGDIAVLNDHEAVVFTKSEICQFICSSLQKIGKDTVSVSIYLPDDDFEITHSFESLTVSVPSMRLDSAVGALCNLSRAEARAHVESSLTDVNYITETKPDKAVKKGDVISVRGFGKFIICDETGTTKRGKIKLAAKKFI